ncbi:UGSC family (seleno)protein, partial [Chloroflexota bacterium]
MRASAVAEKLGYPTASIVCGSFALQGSATASGLGMPKLPMAVIPGNVNIQPIEEMKKNVETTLVDQVIKALTSQPEEERMPAEPKPRDVIFNGTFEDVNRFFYEQEWSDGLPVVPPTVEKV